MHDHFWRIPLHSTLLMMVMSVMWCQLRCHYTLPGNTMFHLNNIRCFTRQKPSKKSKHRDWYAVSICKIKILTWQYNFKKQTHQTTPFKRSRKESNKNICVYLRARDLYSGSSALFVGCWPATGLTSSVPGVPLPEKPVSARKLCLGSWWKPRIYTIHQKLNGTLPADP